MRILLIRHGDPDYENDTLTEKGCREAELLAKRALSLHMGKCYVSPLGRAQRTALPSLEAAGCKAETVEWLQEFPAKLDVKLRNLRKLIRILKKREKSIAQELCGIWHRDI